MNRIAIILISALALGACSKLHKEEQREVAPIPVQILTVGVSESASERCYVGEIEPLTQMPLSHQLGGQIKALHVKSGDRVASGQLIAEFDDTQARSLHEAAAATLRQAEDAYERLQAVHEGGGVSDVRWVQMQTDLEKARQQEILAAKSLADCRMKAPADGVISQMDVHVGQQLLPGQPVCTLLDVQRLQVHFSVPEQEINLMHKGDTVCFTLSALPGRLLRARITDKDVSAGALAHAYGIRAALLSASSDVLPGMVARVVARGVGSEGIVVPSGCVQTTQRGLAVWVVRDGRAERIVVGDTEFVRNGVRVGQGLRPGDEVITAGYQKLFAGAEVVSE